MIETLTWSTRDPLRRQNGSPDPITAQGPGKPGRPYDLQLIPGDLASRAAPSTPPPRSRAPATSSRTSRTTPSSTFTSVSSRTDVVTLTASSTSPRTMVRILGPRADHVLAGGAGSYGATAVAPGFGVAGSSMAGTARVVSSVLIA